VQADATLRAAARAWLADHAPATREQLDAATTDRERFDASVGWQRALFDGGWAGITWPVEYGGRGGTARQASIFAEEQAQFRVSAGFVASTVGMVGPTLLRFGTDEQRDRYLRPLLRADEVWCQLFSEPVAGCDLATLATRAVCGGVYFVVIVHAVW